MTDKKKRNSTDTARRIWLAGIGAYGRAFTEAQEAIKDVTGKSSDVFDELVHKGEMLEFVGKAKGKEILGKAAVPDLEIDERIKAMRSRLSGATKDTDLEARLLVMETKLDKILEILDQNVAKPKKATPKATRKRAATKRTKASSEPTSSDKTSSDKTSSDMTSSDKTMDKS